jgi:hypothetical protein
MDSLSVHVIIRICILHANKQISMSVKCGLSHWSNSIDWECSWTGCWGEREREREAGGWKRLHNEELYSLYASPNIIIIRAIKSKTMTWTQHVARIGEMRNIYKILIRKLDHSEDQDVDGKITSEWILGKWIRKVWTVFIRLRIGASDLLVWTR